MGAQDEVAGRYRLLELLGSGGSGEVWHARDVLLNQDVVLKRSRGQNPGDAAQFERTLAEARALARFRGRPDVITLYDAERIEHGPHAGVWLVMEYASGGSLATRLGMTVEEAAAVGAQVAGALAALHEAGLVHCDIKPANILMSGDDARLADLDAAYRLPAAETVMPNRGIARTPGYAAPELEAGGMPVPASDVYALGMTLLALIGGRQPGGGDDPALRKVDAGGLRPLIDAMCAQDPAERPTVAQVRAQLLGVATTLPPSPAVQRAGAADRLRRRVAVPLGAALGVAALGVAAVAVAVVLALRDGPGGGPAGDEGSDAAMDAAVDAATAASQDEGPLVANQRTADPCALADASLFRGFGQAYVDPDYGGFDRCDVLIEGEDGGVDVEFNLDLGLAPELAAPARTVDGVGVVEQPPASEGCERHLLSGSEVDGEELTVRVEAKLLEGDPDLCALADAAADHAAARLAEGPLPERSPQPPSWSLAWADACALVDPAVLADQVPGVDAADLEVSFGGFGCDWHSTTEDTWVSLRFDRHQPLTAEDGRLTQLGGRTAAVEQGSAGDNSCTVRVEHHEYRDEWGDPTVELVQVDAGDVPGGETAACRMATALAEDAASRLPG